MFAEGFFWTAVSSKLMGFGVRDRGDEKQIVRVRVSVNICREEFSPPWCVCLLVCVSVKKSDLNVFLWRQLIKLFLRDWWVVSFRHHFRCVLRSVKRSVPASLCVSRVVDCASDCVDCRFFFACCDWVYAVPHTSCILIVFLSVTEILWAWEDDRGVVLGFPCGLQFSWCVDAFLSLDVVLFGPFAVVLRWVPQFMLEASFRHVDVYLLFQRVRAAFFRHGVLSFADVWCGPEESLWPNSCVVCCVLCVSRDVSSVLCLFRVCTDFQNTWFPCLVLVWMMSRLIPQGCACFGVKFKSMRRTLWSSSRHGVRPWQTVVGDTRTVVWLRHHSKHFEWFWCLFRACTDFPNTWFPCLCLVWMIIRFIPQSGACYGVKLESMRCTLWQSGKCLW